MPDSGSRPNRWFQLFAGIVCMVAVANMQYGWTFFVNPLHVKHGWDKASIQVAFSIFIIMETWLVPFEVYLADRYGPRPVVLVGGLLVSISWVINSGADTLGMLYLGNAIGGAGAGVVYGTSIGSALKWFPDRRGLAAGLTAAAWGGGTALTVWPMQETIRHFGYEACFLWFGLGQGAIVLVTAWFLRAPRAEDLPPLPPSAVLQSSRSYTPAEVLKTPAFWLLYVMMTMVTTGGLMVIAQIEPIAKDYGVADVPMMRLFGNPITALTLAVSLDRVLNGLTRPFFGWVSDHIGREKTMLIAFSLEAAAIFLLIELAHIPIWFVLLTGLTFFAWGEAFSLFPAIIGDMFGRKYASTNYGLLYTSKGMAALLVPLGSLLHAHSGSWRPIFIVAMVFDLSAALLAWFVLRPLRRRWPADPPLAA